MIEGSFQTAEHLLRQSVAGLGTIQRDDRDVVLFVRQALLGTGLYLGPAHSFLLKRSGRARSFAICPLQSGKLTLIRHDKATIVPARIPNILAT